MHPRALVLSLATLLLVPVGCGGGGGSATEVVDQENAPSSYGLGLRVDGQLALEVAQTFTVGRSGRMTAVEVLLEDFGYAGSEDIVLEVRTTTAGIPDPDLGAVLATGSVPASSCTSPASYLRFDLDTEIDVTVGDTLALVLRGVSDAFCFAWGGGDGTDYGPGALFTRSPSTGGVFSLWLSPVDPFNESDLHFRTWVIED